VTGKAVAATAYMRADDLVEQRQSSHDAEAA